MKKYLFSTVFALLTIAAFAAAQETVSVSAEVPFSFMVGKATLPAGTYHFKPSANLNEMTVSGVNTKEAALTAIVTLLSPRSDNQPMVVFDVVGSNHYLSEVYASGTEGFLLRGATGAHTHESIKGRK